MLLIETGFPNGCCGYSVRDKWVQEERRDWFTQTDAQVAENEDGEGDTGAQTLTMRGWRDIVTVY